MILKRLFFVVFGLFFIACAPKLAIQFEVAKQVNSVAGYQSFLNENPKSIYSGEILDRLELSVINQALYDKDELALNDFVRKYPNSPYIKNVLKLRESVIIGKVFDEVKKEDTLDGYSNFIKKYEGNDLVINAEKLYYKKYIETQEQYFEVSKSPLEPKKERTLPAFKQNTPAQPDTASRDTGQISYNNYPLPSERIDNNVGKVSVALAKVELKEPETKKIEPKELETKTELAVGSKVQNLTTAEEKNSSQSSLIESNPFFQNSAKDFSYLIDSSSIPIKQNPENLLYGKVFRPNTSPRIVQSEFTFFVQTLQRTDNYVRIKTRFHNLKNTQKKFRFSRITLVSSSGRRVRPINIKGAKWSFSSGSIESNNLPNQVSEIDFLFPSLNLFTTNQYKFYITLNNKNYLIQI